MPLAEPDIWSDRLRGVLERYDEPLLRQVVQRFLRPRNQWPVDELVARTVEAASNPATVDRRLEGLEPVCRQVLALIGRSRQPRWAVGSLLEMLVALGQPADFRPILTLLENGLLYPELPHGGRLKSFEHWLGSLTATAGPVVFAHPDVTARVLHEDLGLPACPEPIQDAGSLQEADGLEWPLRLSAVWQLVAGGSLRRTQQGDFFKRDLDRLRGDPLLNAAPAEALAPLPDLGLLAVELALQEGLIRDTNGEITAAGIPASWEHGLPATMESLFAALPSLSLWNSHTGWRGPGATGNPHPAAYLLALLLIGRLAPEQWVSPDTVDGWVGDRHPYWSSAKDDNTWPTGTVTAFLLGLAYPLRLLQVGRADKDQLVVRLSPYGRWLLRLAERPTEPPIYAKTMLVQPNLEIIAYRQGLTPTLIGRLTQFAAWKNLGAACTLQLQPETVYRALEAGQTFETILRTLEQHGMRPTPPAVIESLRTWANKRERLSVYASATLFEFQTPAELNDALARGLPGIRIADRLALVPHESEVDFRNFRLIATRDYGLPLEKCVEVDRDGVTLTVDAVRSDLLLETELPRFAELLDGTVDGRRQYRLTPKSLDAAQKSGVGIHTLEEWFAQRTGQPLTPAARLLLMASLLPALEVKQQLVLQVANTDIADGLMQWPGTRSLIAGRLGPHALAVDEQHLEMLRQRLEELGVRFKS